MASPAAAWGWTGRRRFLLWPKCLLELPDQGLQLGLVEELQLIRRDPLGTGAEALALEDGDEVEQLLDALAVLGQGLVLLLDGARLGFEGLGLLLAPALLRGQLLMQREQLRMQGEGVAEGLGGGLEHGAILP